MEIRDIGTLLTIDEHALLQLLDGKGKVRIRIDNFGKYYVPFVIFTDPVEGEIVPRGVIVRNDCMFAAETRDGILSVIRDIADDRNIEKIETVD
jgi:hypothetical protein